MSATRSPARAAVRRLPWTLIAAALLVVYLFPVYWMLSASFQPSANSASVRWVPESLDPAGYARALEGAGTSLRTSLIVAVGTALVTLVIAVPAAYALSRLRSRAVGVALVLVLVAQMIPGIVLANAFYAMFNRWGLLNSLLGLILANATNAVPFAVILIRSFMLHLDHDVVEAATLDGLGAVGTLVRIVVPLSRNAVITAAIFAFLFSWSDLLFGLTLTTQAASEPVIMYIYRTIEAATTSGQDARWSTVMATSIITSLPAFVLLIVAQRYVKAGIAVGSGK
ncbi:carbohydrate ABC transporter permease [Microbacterium betulae]|uniref:Carbohydrate ABC transporter permease n=1 Tax=Microbacterium betulae TaxID=2981139 RepID=A0AA97I6V4_9MICO|nr:carbohydrate ABC transporter permease [Microbacterium sp. AB]WOF22785.1 carbohydrate ABC transporter permease [Microbacterium sp. AB]